MDAAQLLAFAVFGGIALAFSLALTGAGALLIGRPAAVLAIYLAVLFTFAQSGYGSLEAASNPVYARGTGLLFYPALLWLLAAAALWCWIGRRVQRAEPIAPPALMRWLLAWALLLALHLLWGLAAQERAAEILGSNGFVQVVWIAPLLLLMLFAARDGRTLPWLARGLVLAALAKATFGLARWAFFGGDPANVYRNIDAVDVRLSYFDIGDSLVCLLGAAAAGALWVGERRARRTPGVGGWELVYAVTLVAALACITLSYRRTAWGGLLLVALWALWRGRGAWRWPLALLGLPALAATLAWAASTRLGSEGALLQDLMGRPFGPEPARWLELKLAWEAFAESPLTGQGAWGRFEHGALIPWQDPRDPGAFVHSGLLHLALKAGLPGLLLLAGTAAAFVVQVRRTAAATPAAAALVAAACGGLLFMLPDLLFGTPIPQVRTMQLLGLCLGLPFMVAAAREPVPERAP